MDPELTLAKLQKLLALAAEDSGAPIDERRNAGLSACELMAKEGLAPGASPPGRVIHLALGSDETSREAYRLYCEVRQLKAEIRQLKADQQRRAPFLAAKERSRVARQAARVRWSRSR
jgi:hypothetical protein